MKVRFTMEMAGQKVDETLNGRDATDVVAKAKDRVAKELGWKGLFLKAFTPLAFAQEGVRRYNESFKTSHPIPNTTEEFLELGQQLGYVTILPE